jgi:hypothetical protein
MPSGFSKIPSRVTIKLLGHVGRIHRHLKCRVLAINHIVIVTRRDELKLVTGLSSKSGFTGIKYNPGS